jgi:peptide deformylase
MQSNEEMHRRHEFHFMAKLVTQDHPALHQIAEEVPVSEITSPKIQKVLKDMRAALEAYNVEGFSGVAIAAPQIGVSLRIFLVHDTNANREDKNRIPDLIAINPVITKLSKTRHVVGEGCLSVGENYGAVKRSKNATLRAYDENGHEYERGAGGFLAQIFQHEVDHLDGILFIDRAEKVWHKDDVHTKHLHEAQGKNE